MSLNVKQTVTCDLCNLLFKKPVYLPCLNTVCEQHILESKANKYNCFFCKKCHEVPVEGFKENLMAKSIIESGLYLNEEEKALKAELQNRKLELDCIIKDFKTVQPEFERFSFNHFSDYKNELDLRRENIKLKIDEYFDSCLDKYINDEKLYVKQLDELCINETALQNTSVHLDAKFAEILDNANLSMDNMTKLKDDLIVFKRDFKHKINKIEDLFRDYKLMMETNLKNGINNLSRALNLHTQTDQNNNNLVNDNGIADALLSNDLITCSGRNKINIWNMKTTECKKYMLDPTNDSIDSIHLLSNDKLLIKSETKLKLWDLNEGKIIKVFSDYISPNCLILPVSSEKFVIGSNDTIQVWNVNSFHFDIMKLYRGNVTLMEKIDESLFMCATTENQVEVFSLDKKKSIRYFKHFDSVAAIKTRRKY